MPPKKVISARGVHHSTSGPAGSVQRGLKRRRVIGLPVGAGTEILDPKNVVCERKPVPCDDPETQEKHLNQIIEALSHIFSVALLCKTRDGRTVNILQCNIKIGQLNTFCCAKTRPLLLF
jgi:hypothetical protein